MSDLSVPKEGGFPRFVTLWFRKERVIVARVWAPGVGGAPRPGQWVTERVEQVEEAPAKGDGDEIGSVAKVE